MQVGGVSRLDGRQPVSGKLWDGSGGNPFHPFFLGIYWWPASHQPCLPRLTKCWALPLLRMPQR